MNLSDIKTNFLTLDAQEQLDTILSVRASRRVRKKPLPEVKVKAFKKKNKIETALGSLSISSAEALLAALTGDSTNAEGNSAT